MIDPNSINTITDLRFKTKEIFKKMIKSPVFLFQRSKPRGVLLSIEKYQKMVSQIEDYYDSITLKEYEKEDKTGIGWIPLSEIKKM